MVQIVRQILDKYMYIETQIYDNKSDIAYAVRY